MLSYMLNILWTTNNREKLYNSLISKILKSCAPCNSVKISPSWSFNQTLTQVTLGRDAADVIQVPGQLILKYKKYLGGPNVITLRISKAESSPGGSQRESQKRFKEWALKVPLLALKTKVAKWGGIQGASGIRKQRPYPHAADSQQGNRGLRPGNEKEPQGTRFGSQPEWAGSRFFSLQMRAQPSQRLDFSFMRPKIGLSRKANRTASFHPQPHVTIGNTCNKPLKYVYRSF